MTFEKVIFMKRIAFILVCCFFPGYILFAQNNKIDSLIHELQKAKEDTNKVNILNYLGSESGRIGEYKNARDYAEEAKELADKLSFKKGIARACNVIGLIYYIQGNYSEALKNHFESINIKEKIGDKKGIADSYNNIAIIYKDQGNYPEAIKTFFMALKLYEETGSNKGGEAGAYIGVGNVYRYQLNYAEALKYYSIALDIMKQIGDKQGMASCYVNVGSIYDLLHNNDAALQNYLEGLNIQQESGNDVALSVTYNNIGVIYENLGRYEEALKNFNLSVQICEENKDKQGIAVAYNNVGDVYIKQKKFIKAKEYLLSALDLNNEIGNKNNIRESYKSLAEFSEATGDFKNALGYHKLFSAINDSLLNENNSKQVNELKVRYETEKKDKEIALLNKDKEIQMVRIDKQRATVKYVVAGFSLLSVFALIYFRLYSQRKKVAFQHEILEVKMQALRAQMNPHFTFNILNSIQYYAGENDMKAVQHYLRQFSKLIRLILDQSRTSYIKLEQEIKMLKLYLELEEMRFEKKFEYVLDIESTLDIGKIRIPGMLIQPLVENAIKHGIEHKEGEALIKVAFYAENSTLICSVTDNGIGRSEAMRLKTGDDTHVSAATAIINERMEALSSIYNIRLQCKTEDLFDSAGLASGTCVTIEIPIKSE
jgi:tetratricopeptide (TPR) repeat protein